jgi:hypothetical protein
MSQPIIPTQNIAQLRSLANRGNKEAQMVVAVFDLIMAADSEVVVCRLATTADHALSGVTDIDGVTPADGDLILVKAQTDPLENGVYIARSGAWERLKDRNNDDVIRPMMMVRVSEGAVGDNTAWVVTSDSTTVGTDAINFGQSGSSGGASLLIGDDLGTPDLADADRFLTSVNMQATAYTLDNTTLPAGNPPRNVTITHTDGDTRDTLGDLVVTGTNYLDEVITETITISGGATAAGVKAFKTVTQLVTAGWVIDGAEGTPDTITVGFGTKLGLSHYLTAAAQVFMTALAGVAVAPGAITVDADEIEKNTVDLSAGTYDGSKTARVLIKQ